MTILDVYLHDTLTGHLCSPDGTRCFFHYDPEYLQSGSAIPLSCSLPLRTERHSCAQARPFFAGLLPEETSRSHICDRLGLPCHSDFRLLRAIGGDCAGAVSVMLSGVPLPPKKNM